MTTLAIIISLTMLGCTVALVLIAEHCAVKLGNRLAEVANLLNDQLRNCADARNEQSKFCADHVISAIAKRPELPPTVDCEPDTLRMERERQSYNSTCSKDVR